MCPDNVKPHAASGVFILPFDLILSETEVWTGFIAEILTLSNASQQGLCLRTVHTWSGPSMQLFSCLLVLIAVLWHALLGQINQCQLALPVLSLSPSSVFSLYLFGFVFLFSFPLSVLIYLPLNFSDFAVLCHLCECSISSKGHCRVFYSEGRKAIACMYSVHDNRFSSHWVYKHSLCRHITLV